MTGTAPEREPSAQPALVTLRALRLQEGELLALLEEWPEPNPLSGKPRDLGRTVGEYRHHLLSHFAWEEGVGYLESVVRRAPERARDVESVRDEHEHLRHEIDGLHHEAIRAITGCPPDVESLKARIRSLLGRVRAHERRENRLIHEAFYRDLGTKG